MVINEFNFSTFYAKAFGTPAKLLPETGRALCDHMAEMSWGVLQTFCETQDTKIALISFFNQAYFVGTAEYYYRHGVDFASIEEQIQEAEQIAQSGVDLSQVPFSLEVAWPVENFRQLGLIEGDQQWNGVFLTP